MKRKYYWVLLVLGFTLFLTGCPPIEDTGNIAFSFNSSNYPQTLVPDFDMTPATYIIAGQGPDNSTFQVTLSQDHTTYQQTALRVGNWVITVTSYNASNQLIGWGTSNTVVYSGQTTSVTVTVFPLVGDGQVDLTASWASGVVQMPCLESRLQEPSGLGQVLNFQVAENLATCTQSNINSGYHTLFLELFDDLRKVAGRVEVIRVLKDQVTSGAFILKPGQTGAFEVLIESQPEEPLDVEILDVPESIPVNGSMTARGKVNNYEGNLVYTWYVDAECVGFGQEITISNLIDVKDDYSLDLTVYTPDGRRAGSQNMEFDVVFGNTINGRIIDGQTQENLYNAQVKLFNEQNDLVGLTYTTEEGNFSLGIDSFGTYSLEVNKTGYISYKLENVILNDTVKELQTIQLISENSLTYGDISGYVTSAFTGYGIDSLTVSLREGTENYTGTVCQSTVTQTDGLYYFSNIEAGYYTAEVSGEGYIGVYFPVICVGGLLTDKQNVALTPTIQDSEVRIILTWGEYPYDLDSHLTGPTADESGNQFWISWSNMQYFYGDQLYVALDCDDTNSFGPETITIYNKTNGIYRYSVHKYSYSGSLSSSQAQVRIYFGSNLMANYYVPTNQDGEWWEVFELDGTTGEITPINILTDDEDIISLQDSNKKTK